MFTTQKVMQLLWWLTKAGRLFSERGEEGRFAGSLPGRKQVK